MSKNLVNNGSDGNVTGRIRGVISQTLVLGCMVLIRLKIKSHYQTASQRIIPCITRNSSHTTDHCDTQRSRCITTLTHHNDNASQCWCIIAMRHDTDAYTVIHHSKTAPIHYLHKCWLIISDGGRIYKRAILEEILNIFIFDMSLKITGLKANEFNILRNIRTRTISIFVYL